MTASEKAEEVCYRYNKTNTTVSILISTVSMVGQVILLLVTLLAAVIGATPAGAALSVGNLAGSFFDGAGDLVQCFMTVKASTPLWKKNKNYTFCAGGKYAIMGESGSGKTTLTKIILDLLPAYTGNVWYGNQEQKDVNTESPLGTSACSA